jgi:hypothetical protein
MSPVFSDSEEESGDEVVVKSDYTLRNPDAQDYGGKEEEDDEDQSEDFAPAAPVQQPQVGVQPPPVQVIQPPLGFNLVRETEAERKQLFREHGLLEGGHLPKIHPIPTCRS